MPPDRPRRSDIPPNVRVGEDTLIEGDHPFQRFHSRRDPALVIGAHSTMYGTGFAIGEEGVATIGDHCYLQNVVLLAEREIRIGDFVVIGWNTTIADTDFHPVLPAERVADAIAVSPAGRGRPRPPVERRAVEVEDDVWIGPCVAILKGVTIGCGSVVEAGSVVTRDVPPGSRVLGNPARVVGVA